MRGVIGVTAALLIGPLPGRQTSNHPGGTLRQSMIIGVTHPRCPVRWR